MGIIMIIAGVIGLGIGLFNGFGPENLKYTIPILIGALALGSFVDS